MNMYKTHLDNQLSCKLQPQQDHQSNIRCLQDPSKLDSSIEIRGHMMLSTGSILPMGARNLQRVK